MVLLTTTPYLYNTLSTLPQYLLRALPSLSPPPEVGSPIPHQSLIDLARLSKTQSTTTTTAPYPLSTLLRGTSVYIPPPAPPPAPSPEYLALKKHLLEQRERREYAELVNRGSALPRTAEEDAADKGRDDITPSLVVNILLSVLLCAGATFYLTRWWGNDGLRVLLALFVGIVVGVAETGVYAGYLRKVEQSRAKERRKREVKTVIGEYAGEEGGAGVVEGEKEGEEIWGRGVNGGVRRRVRERWEKGQEQS